jgi:cytochrome c peroxidase
METLWDVMDHYNKGDGIADLWLDKNMQPLALSESEIGDVVAFVAALTSPQYKKVGDEEYTRQLAISIADSGIPRVPSARSQSSQLRLPSDRALR